MMSMRGILYILLLMMMCGIPAAHAVSSPCGQVNVRTFVTTDTVSRTDTVITREVIHRRDIVTRQEEVIRVDTIIYTNGRRIVKKGVERTPSFPVETVSVSSAGVVDSVIVSPEVGKIIPGGKYVWIPDSIADEVGSLMAGSHVLKERDDDNTLVSFRGDTIPVIMKDRNLGRFNRGLFNYLFIPRGMWQIGMTAAYAEINTEDLEVLDLMSDIDISGHIYSIKPYFSYFIGNNTSVGMRFSYTRGIGHIDSFKVDIDDDMNFNLKDIMYSSESYMASMTYNQYFGITRNGRFGIFNEVELGFASGNSDFRRPYNGVPKLTHTTTTKTSLNFSPGLCIFIMDQVSFNVSFGVFGFYIKHEKQQEDGVDSGRRTTSGANFRFNIFNINFGIAVNI